MKCKELALVALLSLAPLPAHAIFGTEIGVRGGVWIPQLSGNVKLDGAGDGTELDVKDDLEWKDSVDGYVPGAEVFLKLGRNRLTLAGASVDYAGSGRVTAAAFGDETFTGAVKSSLQYTLFDLAYERTLVDFENWVAGFSVSALVDVKYLTGALELRGGGRTVKDDFRLPMPLVGLGAHLGILLDLLEARVGAAAMAYSGNRVIEAFGEVVLSPLPFVDLGVGYRYFTFKADSDKVVGGSGGAVFDYAQQGPYVNLTVKIGL